MKTMKKGIALLLVLSLVALCIPASMLSVFAAETSGECGDNLTWSFNQRTGRLTITGTGGMWDYTTSNGAPWYSLSVYALTLTDGITRIGDCAFLNQYNMSSVNIPTTVDSIGDLAFCSCESLVSLVIPGNVKTIGSEAFACCSNLENLTLENGIETIGSYAFDENLAMTSLTIPGSVQIIEEGAFYWCEWLETLVIEDGVGAIGANAFDNCPSLSTVTIGKIDSIGDGAFRSCLNMNTVSVAGVKSIGNYAFASMESITLPADVTSIGESAIYNTTVYGYTGSYVETYVKTHAAEYNLSFVSIGTVSGGDVGGGGDDEPPETPKRGDANDDGTINAKDYSVLKRGVVGTYTLSDVQKVACDINGDGTVNSSDYGLLKRAVVGTYTME